MRIAAALVMLAVLSGCATAPKVEVQSVDSAKVSSSGAYAWAARRAGTSPNPYNNSALWRTTIRSAVDRQLAAKGYTSEEITKAGWLVAFHLVLHDGGVNTIIDNYNVSEAPGTEAHLDEFLKTHGSDPTGTLVVDALDRSTGKLLWRGWAVVPTEKGLSVQARNAKIERVAASVLANFPARSR